MSWFSQLWHRGQRRSAGKRYELGLRMIRQAASWTQASISTENCVCRVEEPLVDRPRARTFSCPVDRHCKTRGQQYQFGFDRFSSPIDQLLKSARKEAEDVLKRDPSNRLASGFLASRKELLRSTAMKLARRNSARKCPTGQPAARFCCRWTVVAQCNRHSTV